MKIINNNQQSEKQKFSCTGVIITLLIIAALIFLGIFIYMKKEGAKPFSREATNNDITITSEELDLKALGETIIFNPKCDIDNLQITFDFKNDNTTLQKIVKDVGNVKEGTQYNVNISITELNWNVIKNAMNIQCYFYISGGTTYVFN